MYCKNCGKEIADDAIMCIHCGVATENNAKDDGNIGWSLLGCCIPVVGLILFLVWQDSKPKTAKKAGLGALVSVASIVSFYLIWFIIGIAAASSL